jgi:hypothetical protein
LLSRRKYLGGDDTFGPPAGQALGTIRGFLDEAAKRIGGSGGVLQKRPPAEGGRITAGAKKMRAKKRRAQSG